ncbi:MAG: amidase [Rubrivivax sp.]|nr:amidase [Rubrivivax sp.]MBK8530036.1 amidase [Rubrivivax sp.]
MTQATLPRPWFDADASALAQAIVRGDCSAEKALQRTLADVAAINPALNAVCLLAPEIGLARARELDTELAACRNDDERAARLRARPFFGVPLLLKDVGAATAHRGLPSRAGSRLFPQGAPWPVDGTLTQRYLAAGFVPFGRSTSPEMGMSATTEAVAYGGPTRNPWNRAHSSGGSSGGAAAATASGMTTIAHANDGAGSIRIPASACGLIGLKPSRGLMPTGPLVGEGWGGLAIDHVLTRSVRDCAAALDVTAGADAGAPYAAPPLPASCVAALADPPRRLRIGLIKQFYEGDAVHPEVAAVLQEFALQLQRLGHAVEEASIDFTTHEVVFPVMQGVATGTALFLDQLAASRGRAIDPGEVEPVVWSAYQHARSVKATDYLAAINTFHRLGRRMAVFHERFDLLLTPTLAEPPAVLGRFTMDRPDFIDYRLGPTGLWRYTPFCPLANATGAPAISLPVGRSASGLPIGAMLSALHGQDLLLLQLAAQWEAVHGPVPLAGERP